MQSIIDYIERRNRETPGDDFAGWVIDGICDKMTNDEARQLMNLLEADSTVAKEHVCSFLRRKLRQAYQHKAEEV